MKNCDLCKMDSDSRGAQTSENQLLPNNRLRIFTQSIFRILLTISRVSATKFLFINNESRGYLFGY